MKFAVNVANKVLLCLSILGGTLFADITNVSITYPETSKNYQYALDNIVYLEKDTFSIGYDKSKRVPAFAVVHIDEGSLIKQRREQYCIFAEDMSIPEEFRSNDSHYKNSGFDRGHIVPYASADKTIMGAVESCRFSNIAPQYAEFNRGFWKVLEEYSRNKYVKTSKSLYEITGTYFDDNTSNDMYTNSSKEVQVPEAFWKILIPSDASNTVDARIEVYFYEHKKKKVERILTLQELQELLGFVLEIK